MKKLIIIAIMVSILFLNACAARGSSLQKTEENDKETASMKLDIRINGSHVQVDWEDNEAVRALKDLCKDNSITIQMSMYGGFEQVGMLEKNLPRNDKQTTTTAGDIVLYSGNQIVVFYGSNSWSYTRLGRIKDKSASELEELLGREYVTITISSY